ncbi:MAG: ACP S-malonyltransferase [Anaerovoracaceae bacterium]
MNNIAFVYPGQGAQAVGMGKEFFEEYEQVKKYFNEASDIMGIDMAKLCFEDNELLDQTRYTQAALLLVSGAITEIVKSRGLSPKITAGLSLGEYSAIVAASGMDLMDGIKVVKQRGILMEEAVPKGVGGMAAVIGLDGDKVSHAISDMDDVFVANYNTQKQIVITGSVEGINKSVDILKSAGAKGVMPLNVSGPFHSPYLKEAGELLGDVLQDINLTKLDIPYVTNVTAEIVKSTDETKELLKKQVSTSVMWQQSIEKIIGEGIDTFIEIGPGVTIKNMIKKIDKTVKVYNISTVTELEKVLGELGC